MWKKMHKFYILFIACLCYLPFLPLLLFWSKHPEKHYKKITRIRKRMLKAVAFLIGVRFQVSHDQSIDWSRNYIFCANHSSILDILAMEFIIRKPFSFLGKNSLLTNPLTRIFFKSVDIPVDRNSKLSSYHAYKSCHRILSMGYHLAIFPEGGIDEGIYPPRLQPFKKGLFRLAIEQGIPVVPVVIHDLWLLCWDEAQLGTQPGTCHIEVLEPVDVTGYGLQDEMQLRELVRKQIGDRINMFRPT